MRNPTIPSKLRLAVDPSGNLCTIRIVEEHSTEVVNSEVVATVAHRLKSGWRWANDEEIARHEAAAK